MNDIEEFKTKLAELMDDYDVCITYDENDGMTIESNDGEVLYQNSKYYIESYDLIN